MNANLQVMIVGAGTGGLTLAHGLRAAGIDVRVFERDHTPTDRPQGYRLNISATGNRALAQCLPPENLRRFINAAALSNTAVTFLDSHLRRLLRIAIAPHDPSAVESERPISRIALRKILLEGLEKVVVFGKRFVGYETLPDGRVAAHFQDGSSAIGDILVGADGAGSRVRGQLLPEARRLDTGIVAVSGKFPLDQAARREVPSAVFQGPTLVTGPGGCFLFAGAVEYPPSAGSSEYDREEYVMWGFSARARQLAPGADIAGLPGEQAGALVLAKMRGWHPDLRRLIERADPASVTSFAVKSAEKERWYHPLRQLPKLFRWNSAVEGYPRAGTLVLDRP